MNLENLDIFYCGKCGQWFSNIRTSVFEEHCTGDNCPGLNRIAENWDEDDDDNGEKEKQKENGIESFLYPTRQTEADGSCTPAAEQQNPPNSSISDSNFEVTELDNAKSTNNKVDELDEDIPVYEYVLICGQCNNEFHEIDKFKEHRSSGACSHEKVN